MHFDHYNNTFTKMVGGQNVGWFGKNFDGIIVDCDPAFNFAEMANIDPDNFIGNSVECLPWGHLAEQIKAADVLCKFGEVRETIVTYWHPGDFMYRRVLGAKFLQRKNIGHITTIFADITFASITRRVQMLQDAIIIDWKKEQITIEGKAINRVDLIVLAYYLENLTYKQIGLKVHKSKKSIDKRLCKMRDILCGLDPDTSTLFEVCKKYHVDKMFKEKTDWFDRLPVVTPTNHLQFKL